MGFIFLRLNSISGLLLELLAEHWAVSWLVCYCSSRRVPDRRRALGGVGPKILLLEVEVSKASAGPDLQRGRLPASLPRVQLLEFPHNAVAFVV